MWVNQRPSFFMLYLMTGLYSISVLQGKLTITRWVNRRVASSPTIVTIRIENAMGVHRLLGSLFLFLSWVVLSDLDF